MLKIKQAVMLVLLDLDTQLVQDEHYYQELPLESMVLVVVQIVVHVEA